MTATRAVFFDVAHTLLDKPSVMSAWLDVLRAHGVTVSAHDLQLRHQLLREAIPFPDRTSRPFYDHFNAAMLRALGVVPTDRLLEEIFSACTYRSWEPFADVGELRSIPLPLGVLSNWDTSLQAKLAELIDVPFRWLFGSAEQGLRKPDPDFFRLILDQTGLPASQVAYVGDSVSLDMEPALGLGMRAILLDRHDLFPTSPLPRIRGLDSLAGLL